MIRKSFILGAIALFARVSSLAAQTVDTATVVISGGQAVVIAIPKTGTPGVRMVSRSVGDNTHYQQIGTLSRPSSFSAFSNIAGDTVVNALKKIKKITTDKDLWSLIQSDTSYKEFGFAMVSLKFLKAIGWAFVDPTLEKIPVGTQIYYKVTDAASGITDTGSCVTGRQPGDCPPQLVNKQSSDSLIYLRWGYKRLSGGFLPRYAAVYMKNAAGVFSKQHFYAYGTVSRDSVCFSMVQHVTPRLEYTYYIQPVDFFGNPVPVHSDTVSMVSIDFGRTPPVEKVTAADTKEGILISWKKKLSDPFLSSLSIQRATSVNGNYSKLQEVAVTDSAYLDKDVLNGQQYYYRLKIAGQNEPAAHRDNFSGYASASHSAKYEKPDAPYQVRADRLQRVMQLSWEAVRSPATAGYFVYRSATNDTTGMLQISGLLPGTTFIDSTKDQSRRTNYSYAVKAVNMADLKSNYSALVQGRLSQGTDGPLVPAYITVSRNAGNILVQWQNTKSTDNYIKGYRVYKRKIKPGENLQYDPAKKASDQAIKLGFYLVSPVLQTDPDYSEAVSPNDTISYAYAVTAVDVTGAESGLSALGVTTFHKSPLAAPIQLSALPLDKTVELKWVEVNITDLTGYHLYRKGPNEKGYKKIAEIGPKQNSYVDAAVQPQNVYLYKVKSVDSSGESTGSANKAVRTN